MCRPEVEGQEERLEERGVEQEEDWQAEIAEEEPGEQEEAY